MSGVSGGVTDRIADEISDHPGRVTALFLIVTVLLLPGVFLMETDPGTERFIEGVDEADTLEDVTLRFESTFGPNEPSTQLIQTEDNVLTRSALATQLEVLEELHDRERLRVTDTMAAAPLVAEEIDPQANTPREQREVVEAATQQEIHDAVRALSDDPVFTSLTSEDLNPAAGEASATIVVVTHALPTDDDDQLMNLQHDVAETVGQVDETILVFGQGVLESEFQAIVYDSLAIVVPATILLILGLLLAAYRDPFDLVLGTAALVMTIVWTFGFAGYIGLPFNQLLIAVPILLLAIGIDFGIHMIDRYREHRLAGGAIRESMEYAAGHLLVAYGIIAGTTVVGFAANVTSELEPVQEFGIVAGLGMTFTLFIFGVFLPAAKVWLDERRDAFDLPSFGSDPIATEESALGRILKLGAVPARRVPVVFVVATLLVTAALGGYGAGVDTSFEEDDFLPPEEMPGYVEWLPEVLQPSEYTVAESVTVIEEEFAAGDDDTITIRLRGELTADDALQRLVRVEEDPPETFVETDGSAESRSILVPMALAAREDPTLAAMISRNDRTGDDIPNRNIDAIYDEVFDSPYGGMAEEYLTTDRDEARIVIEVRSEAAIEDVSDDARSFAERYRGDATATGQILVYQAVADAVFESAVQSFLTAIAVAGGMIILLYHLLFRRPLLGASTLVPITVTVCLLTATMRWLGIPFNALTATILSISIGLGVDYTVHFTHRYHEERETSDPVAAVTTTLRGTGGALTGTMLTTTIGLGALVLAVTPILGQFGLLTALSIVYSYLTTHILLPPFLIVLERFERG